MSSPPFKVKAVYEYNSPHEDDLSFPNGQIITVTEEEDADWYVGEYTDASGEKHTGLFPKNFVEKYEPAPPPRPVRAPRPKPVEAEPPTSQVERDEPPRQQDLVLTGAETEQQRAPPAPTETPAVAEPNQQQVASPPASQAKVTEPQPEPPAAPKPAPAVPAAKSPPAVAEKPSSFRDRIAAFNKPAAAPIAPFKPAAPPTGFIKKPFVAPPPSRDAYVPPPREPVPQKIYRRDEDPEIAERQAQDQESAERAGLAGSTASDAPEDAPKPTSLKERIALLQKQQMEQAARRAEPVNKEKPKRPPKQRTESYERGEVQEPEGAGLEKVQSRDSTERGSLDTSREPVQAAPPARNASRGPRPHEPAPQDRDTLSDANDADQSAAGETTEDAEGTSTGVDDEEEGITKAATPPARATAAPAREPDVGDQDDTTEDEEGEVDEETRRHEELRERMAKLSGGMGMAGMFGPPGGMPMPGAGLKKKKPPTAPERPSHEEARAAPEAAPAPRIPMIPVPGMAHMHAPRSEDAQPTVEKEHEESHPITDEHAPEEVPDVEDLKAEAPPQTHTEAHRSPPLPQGILRSFGHVQVCDVDPLAAFAQDHSISDVERCVADADEDIEMRGVVRVLKRQVPPPPPVTERSAPPPIPGDRPVMHSLETRPVPPPPPALQSPSAGSVSDDEMTESGRGPDMPIRGAPPPVPGASAPPVPNRMETPRSPQSPPSKRVSYFGSDVASPNSPLSPTGAGVAEKGTSRVPPIPITSPTMIPHVQARPPPPPPPTAAPPSRQSTADTLPGRVLGQERDMGESEYEGDYDTDIGSGAKHKEALKAHAREPSLDDSTTADETPVRSPTMHPMSSPPPIPPAAAPRAVPPPPPPTEPQSTRKSMDASRAVPPIPPPREPPRQHADEEYDPYRYTAPPSRVPLPPPGMPPPMPAAETPRSERNDDDLYSSSPPGRSFANPPALPPQPPPHTDRPVPPPPPQAPAPPPTSSEASPVSRALPNRRSLDADRALNPPSRRSTEQPRPSTDQGYMATDIDLGLHTHWWAHPNTPPPAFQSRKDILLEIEEASTAKRGGRTTVSKDVYVLFPDYSQTVVTARFDSRDVEDVTLEQRHEPPPARLRQDQLEAAWARFGQRIAGDAQGRQGAVVGDGTPAALVTELLRGMPGALGPVGTRAYGALVYVNIANATVQQFDEIRPGDVVSFRNARFQGKHGAMHAKYSVDVGKPDHVGVVVDWDGRKRKLRAWEQGREKRKVGVESWRVEDLRSGEVRVWRVMGRDWVGWEGGS